ncbi:unnamed protein product [Lepidochelys kempii]
MSSPSDPVDLAVTDPSLPRPSISLSPTGVTAPGADVTIRCRGQSQDVRFFLHKAGDLNPPRHMDPAGDGAEFHIPTVGRQHGGSYGCSYRPRGELGPLCLTSHILAGASAAAAGLLLLVAFLCFRKTRASVKRSCTETQQHQPYGGIKGISSERPRLGKAAPESAQPSMYTAINMPQGAPQ